VEALAAGGYEAIAAEVGPDSFTTLLVNELALAAMEQRPISASDIHSRLLQRISNYQTRSSETTRASLLSMHKTV
jgi:hypothetical protein